MLIGLTYDARTAYLAAGYAPEETAEFDSDFTITALADTIAGLGHDVDRIGSIRDLAAALVAGRRWDLVFNIAEGLRGIGREAQVPCLLEAYDIPCVFSDPMVLTLTLHKGMTKRVIRDAGLNTPDFVVVESLEDLRQVRFPGPWFAKPVAEGTGKGVTSRSVVRERGELEPICAELLATFHQPVLIEEFLPGREFTVGIVGTGPAAATVGTMEVELLPQAEQDVYSYTNKENCESLVRYVPRRPTDEPLVAATEALALAAWRVLGCRDGGRLDLRCDAAGKPAFIEVNPLAGLHPEHSDLPIICGFFGIPYAELIRRIIASAAARLPATADSHASSHACSCRP